jgi:hypothetical protein
LGKRFVNLGKTVESEGRELREFPSDSPGGEVRRVKQWVELVSMR